VKEAGRKHYPIAKPLDTRRSSLEGASDIEEDTTNGSISGNASEPSSGADMIDWLISWGRSSVVFGALFVILLGLVIGWNIGGAMDHYPWNILTFSRLVGAIFGVIGGAAAAATIFGIAAAIFDIQENVRIIARAADSRSAPSGYPSRRREPTFEGS
jgi:hypothetical protein